MANAFLLDCGSAVTKQLKPLLTDRGYRVSLDVRDAHRPVGPVLYIVGPSPGQEARLREVVLGAQPETCTIALTAPHADPLPLVRAGADEVFPLPAADSGFSHLIDLAEARLAARAAIAGARPGSHLEALLLDQVNAAVIVTEPGGRIVYWNRFAEKLYGWTRDEALGRQVEEITPGTLSRDEAARVMDTLRHGEPWEGEFTVRRKDGSEFVAHVVDAPLRDASGRLLGIVGVSSDVTPILAARAEAHRLDTLLAHVVDGAAVWVAIVDPEGKYIYSNRMGFDVTGYREEELLTMNFRQVVAPEQLPALEALLQQDLAANPARDRIVDIIRKDGACRTLRISAGALVEDGQVTGIVGTAADVTEELERVRELQRHALIYEHISDAVIVSDLERRIVDMNPAAERLTGYSRGEAIGMPTAMLLRPEDAAAVASAANEGVQREGMWRGEAVFVRKDGTLGICETVTAAMLDAAGVPIGRVAVHRDVTERRSAEKSQREAEDFRRWVMDSVSEGIFALDFDGHVTLANGRACEMVGLSFDELAGQHFSRFLRPQAAEDLARTYVALVRDGAPSIQYETDLIAADGRVSRVLFTAAPLRREGEIVGVVGTGEDITAAARNQELVRESETRFRALAEAAFDGVIISQDNLVMEANDAAARMLGYQPGELANMEVTAFHPPEFWPLVLTQRGLPATEPYEVLGLRKDGSTFPVELVGRDCEFHGKPARITAMRDLTAQKRAAEALVRAEKLDSLGVLSAGIAHDLNNILVGILANVGAALEELPSGSRATAALAEIEFAAQRAADLARSMLAYSGTATIALEPVDISLAAQEMLHLARTTLTSPAVARLELDDGLPPVVADPGQVRQVLFNLVLNSLEAVAESGSTVTIRSFHLPAGAPPPPGSPVGAPVDAALDYVGVTVSDDGPGIAPEARERIFDPFFSTRFTGRGLGLASVLGIVKAHSGVVLLESAPGRGSAFTVLLPAATPDAMLRRPPAPAGWKGTGTILVIDDDDSVRTVTRRVLEQMGFSVLLADDGAQGVERFAAEASRVTCVLMDMTMPRMDGARATEAIHRIRPNVPVVLMSGFTEQEARERFAGIDLAAFLQKPFALVDLRAVLASVLG